MKLLPKNAQPKDYRTLASQVTSKATLVKTLVKALCYCNFLNGSLSTSVFSYLEISPKIIPNVSVMYGGKCMPASPADTAEIKTAADIIEALHRKDFILFARI